MSFFNRDVPILARKRSAFDLKDAPGLWRIHWQVERFIILSTFYTRHDQACLLWGLVAAGIFITAQFLPLSWTVQAIFASTLTLGSVAGMVALTWYFTAVERLTWVLYSWVALMLIGTLLTDLGVFLQWGNLLVHICPLWLGLSAIGYGITGIGMRSRTFAAIAVLHLLTIWGLSYVGIWQPLTTGAVISGSALLIAELQWDANGVCGYQTTSETTDSPSNSPVSEIPAETLPIPSL
jgi:hypothetical protein